MHRKLQTAISCGKITAVTVAVLWGLVGVNSLGTAIKDLSYNAEQLNDQYVGLSLANSDLINALSNMGEDAVLLKASIDSLEDHIALQGEIIIDNQVKSEKQFEDLIEFLIKTQPEHKAELQLFVGKYLETP